MVLQSKSWCSVLFPKAKHDQLMHRICLSRCPVPFCRPTCFPQSCVCVNKLRISDLIVSMFCAAELLTQGRLSFPHLNLSCLPFVALVSTLLYPWAHPIWSDTGAVCVWFLLLPSVVWHYMGKRLNVPSGRYCIFLICLWGLQVGDELHLSVTNMRLLPFDSLKKKKKNVYFGM